MHLAEPPARTGGALVDAIIGAYRPYLRSEYPCRRGTSEQRP